MPLPQWVSDLARLLELLLRSVTVLGLPSLAVGLFYLLAPESVLQTIGLPKDNSLGRAVAGIAVSCGAAVILFVPPFWQRDGWQRVSKWTALWVRYWLLPVRSKLWLGPASVGREACLYFDPNDEDAQLLIDREFLFAAVSGENWVRGVFTHDGNIFVAFHRKRLRNAWKADIHKAAVSDICGKMESAECCAHGRV